MTVDQVEVDPNDAQLARRAAGRLAAFNDAGVIASADVHVAARLGRLGQESDERVLLAAALAVRALRQGAVCVDIDTARETTPVESEKAADLAWPDAAPWLAALAASPLVAVGSDPAYHPDRPLRLVDSLLYLDRYWRQEQVVAGAVDDAALREQPAVDEDRLRAAYARLFVDTSAAGITLSDRQQLAGLVAAHRWLSVIAGGPGTGKTTVVARVIALLQDQGSGGLRVALAAPTALAAARLADTASRQAALLDPDDHARLGPLVATTLHRLLGWKPGAQMRFRHDRSNRLPHDVVVVDEASMVSVTMMARLVEALRPTTRLILVGDPSQLTSVEAGAVFGDLVHRPPPADAVVPGELERLVSRFDDVDAAERHAATATGVVELARGYRFSGAIEGLADAVREGDSAAAVEILRSGADGVSFVDADPAAGVGLDDLRADVVAAGRLVAAEALAGRASAAVAALGRHRLLCAHREGRYGVARWSAQVETWLREAIDGYASDGLWYVGSPLLVPANDSQADLLNGDTGVIVDVDGRPQAAIARDAGVRLMPTSRLSDVQTLHAMSVHKSQGSQFRAVTIVLPTAESSLLTRELFYTAITRAEQHVRVVGTSEAVAAAVARPIGRASGLRRRR